MLRDVNQVTTRRSKLSSWRQANVLRATCLLCRVLWPMVVQHRHLVFEDVRKERRPHVQRCTLEDKQSAGRLVFQYSEEISIDGPSSS
jgi:hypothetical protein